MNRGKKLVALALAQKEQPPVSVKQGLMNDDSFKNDVNLLDSIPIIFTDDVTLESSAEFALNADDVQIEETDTSHVYDIAENGIVTNITSSQDTCQVYDIAENGLVTNITSSHDNEFASTSRNATNPSDHHGIETKEESN